MEMIHILWIGCVQLCPLDVKNVQYPFKWIANVMTNMAVRANREVKHTKASADAFLCELLIWVWLSQNDKCWLNFLTPTRQLLQSALSHLLCDLYPLTYFSVAVGSCSLAHCCGQSKARPEIVRITSSIAHIIDPPLWMVTFHLLILWPSDCGIKWKEFFPTRVGGCVVWHVSEKTNTGEEGQCQKWSKRNRHGSCSSSIIYGWMS